MIEKELGVPELLYRITYPDKLLFSHQGYLLPHGKENLIRGLLFKGKIPMVTEQDWEYVARYFAINLNSFLRLTILSGLVEDLRAGRHSYLSGLEYFGRVSQMAITDVRLYGWEGNKPILKDG
jgi:hypothetical protein